MGTKVGLRTAAHNISPQLIRAGESQIAQLLHPVCIARDDVDRMADLLHQVDSLLDSSAPGVRLVLTGGGFLEFLLDESRTSRRWRSEDTLEDLAQRCLISLAPAFDSLSLSPRDYVIGVDFVSGDYGVGQFAVLVRSGTHPTITWKSYPVDSEGNTLAGFGTPKGRSAPRIAKTALGTTLLLVCHDAQAFNHRNRALVGRAKKPSARTLIMNEVTLQMDAQQPAWALNLVHFIEKLSSISTFHKSYKQIQQDNAWRPKVVGSFGYDKVVIDSLGELSGQAQFPDATCRCTIALVP